jgi:integrase
MKRQRSGSLYHHKHPPEGVPYAVAKAAGTLKESPIWWAKYYVNGRTVRVSTGTEKQQEAERFLADRMGRVATGQPILPRADRVRYEELAADLRAHYAVTGCRGLKEAGWRLSHLDRYFTGRRAADIGQAEATAYALQRQAAGAANGTVNRELAVLGKMLRLAYKQSKLLRLPVFTKLKEAGPRQGFFEREQYEAVRRHLRADLQVALDLAHTYGWRMRSEVLALQRRHLDLDAGTVRLDPGTTKNDEGRIVYLPPGLKSLLAAQVARVEALEKKLGRIIPDPFPHLRGAHQGTPIRNFRKAWASACKAAGVAGRTRHDLRRTAVRNLVNAGVVERVAMTVTGHRTRRVFDAYHIVSPADLQDVARKLAEPAVAGIVAEAGIISGIRKGAERKPAP